MSEHQQIQQSKKPDTIFQKQATPVVHTPLSNPYSIIQRARINPKSLTHANIMQLQRTIGNRAVGRLLSSIGNSSTAQQATVQRQEIPEEEEPLQGKMAETVQRQEIPEEEEPLQGKFESIQRQEIPEEEEPLQSKMAVTIQRQEIPEEEEPLQGKMIGTIQRQEIPEEEEPLQGKFENEPEIACPSYFAAPIGQKQEIPEEEEPLQGKMIGTVQRLEIPEEEPLQTKMENNTGMPDNLKSGMENLSGIDMSGVRVHYNSDKPAEVGALAYTKGTDIHVASGQERHLPHEAWHVVQQAQGRVQPTMQAKGVSINDDPALEREADLMGEKAANQKSPNRFPALQRKSITNEGGLKSLSFKPLQRQVKLQAMANLYAPVQMIPRRIGGHWYGSAGQIAGTRYRVVRRYNTQNYYLHHRDTEALLPQIWTLAEIMQIRVATTALKAIGEAGLHDVIFELITQVESGTVLNAAIASIKAIKAKAYVYVNAIPSTACNIVRRVNSTQHLIEDTDAGEVLTFSMDKAEAAAFRAAFINLVAEGVINLKGLVYRASSASGKIPIKVTTARLSLIQANVHNVILTRIAADHAAIRGMLANRIDATFANAFESIEIPGSDPHKGGQVVAFINYRTINGGTARIVYKPSDLAMDMLLYNSAASVAATLGEEVAHYEMMPMHVAAPPDPRLADYGYMKFVEGAGPQNAGQMLSVFRSLGSNLAVAYVFGLRDIHNENFILLADRIQLIDMEAATGTFRSFKAMELNPFTTELCDRIGMGLVGVANNVVKDWLPNDATLISEVRNGFTTTLNNMRPDGPNKVAMEALVTRASQAATRFVPFETKELQERAGKFHGFLAEPRPEVIEKYNNSMQELATSAAGPGASQAYLANLLTMLLDQTTKDALNQGDVPYWTRQGNTIFGENGVQQVAALAHPRLDTQANIAAGINARRTPAPIGDPRPASPTALYLLNNQFISLHLNNIRDRISNAHKFKRISKGHNNPPNY